MGITFSSQKQAQPNTATLADALVTVPTLLDGLDSKELRSLAMVNRDLRQIVDQPETWKRQFAKEIGSQSHLLPAPPAHVGLGASSSAHPTPAFKTLCRGLAILEFEADHPEQQIRHDTLHQLLWATTRLYIDEHASSLVRELDSRRGRIERHRAHVADLKFDAGALAAGTGVIGGLTAGQGYLLTKVNATVAACKTAKMAAIVASLGTKGAKIYLYAVFGFNMLMGTGMTAGFAYLTGQTVLEMRRARRTHAVELQRTRVQARIDAGRQIQNAHEAQQ